MYLRRKPKWSMTRKRYKVNWFLVTVLMVLIALMVYVDRVIVPTIPPPFVPTPTATRSPESYVAEAEASFADGKLLQAIDFYQQAVKANPSDDTVYVAMGRVQVFAGLYKDAQSSAEAAILLNANNPRAHAVRAWALDFLGDYLNAEAAIKRALELDPNSGFAHAIYTEILVDSFLSGEGPFENLAKAAEESKVALALEPNTIETHRARGYILEATANYEEAIAEYQAAININSNISDLHLALGRNYRAQQVYDKAVEEFTRANALNPSDPNPDLFISRTYATIGEFAKAAQYGESAVKDAPADASLRGNYGVMLYYTADWAEAAVQLGLTVNGGRTAEGAVVEAIPLTTDARVVEYYYTYALALARTNRCGEAIPLANTIIGRVPADEVAVASASRVFEICEANISVTPTFAPASATATATTTP
ncbi:MAG: tetratricopeptide repeat protein [Anaerolineaceae bacterium]|nr:MAG: tetratricopeptide repeat protein [Anaerolineaceae bacterium]